MRRRLLISMALILLVSIGLGQRRRGGGWGWGGGEFETASNPREIGQHGNQTPNWTNTSGFENDVYTFVRIRREHSGRSGGPWWTDAPDADLNLAYRLQQMTSLKVNPDGLFLKLTDPEVLNYPFIYMVEPGSLYLNDEEVVALRKYLENGGFLMLDDFWGEYQWEGMANELRKVFPKREWVELPIEHPLYHCVFDIKSKGQVPNVQLGMQSEHTGVTWEYHDGEECKEVHHRVIYDDKGRIMVMATHNTDNGDGWEWEGDNRYFFEHFSEKISYPLAVNILFYCMTH